MYICIYIYIYYICIYIIIYIYIITGANTGKFSQRKPLLGAAVSSSNFEDPETHLLTSILQL